jgi:hypothetical protein
MPNLPVGVGAVEARVADSLENLIARSIERFMSGRFSERHGLVTSYDSKKYLAKVMLKPQDQESGWLPIETGHIGKGYGVAVGLKPGSGGAQSGAGGAGGGGGGGTSGSADGGSQQAQGMGDQVIVRFEEGDFESGKIVQRVHSNEDTPPEVKAGEMVAWTKFDQSSSGGGSGGQQSTGQKIFWKEDGSISMEDGAGAKTVMDGKGSITTTAL